MDKLLYVGHSYHLKTKSTGFLIDLLKTCFDVDTLADDSWSSGSRPDIDIMNSRQYNAIVFFQTIPRNQLGRIKCNNITFFPMYDGCNPKDTNFWYDIRQCKILNFSSTVQTALGGYGFQQHYVQYYPEPRSEAGSGAMASGLYFWQRRKNINWMTIKSLIGNERVGPIHIHRAVDPGVTFISPTPYEQEAYDIGYSDWFTTREEYLAQVQSKRFYIAPRIKEGIGLAFLEAMAMGRAVIAPNDATMNEYIFDGKNGYLFEPANPGMLDLRHSSEVCEATLDSIAEGRKRWEKSAGGLLDFVASPYAYSAKIRKRHISIIKKAIRSVIKIMRKIYELLITKSII